MLQEIKDLQSNSVKSLIRKVETQNEVTFKAPTGSGKTYMMADMMNQILVKHEIVFIVSTLSKAGLGKQNYEKFLEYNSSFPNLKPFLINSEVAAEERVYIPVDFNVYVLPRDLYKDKAKIKSSGAMFNFLLMLKFMGKIIYLIRDESHIATNNLDDLNDQFSKIINISATPKYNPDVEITYEQAVNAKLIKKLAEESKSENDNLFNVNQSDGVDSAVEKFLKIKARYINELKVNPCLIIQISNKDKADEEWRKIKKIVDDPTKNIKWMYIVDDAAGKGSDTNDEVKKLPVSKWKDYVKNNESLIDVIIFKMVLTEGWDIPRACMLYQVRDSQSKQMDEQVIGRVRRNPILLNWELFDEEAHKLALTCWIWGIVDSKLRNFKKVTIKSKKNFEIKTTKINSITKQVGYNFDQHISVAKSKTNGLNVESIFNLSKKWNKVSEETIKLCWDRVKSYEEWIYISSVIEEIDKENNAYMSNYENSVELNEISSFPENSYFEITDLTTDIEDWIWIMNDSDDEEYHFDSEAEKNFAKLMKKLKVKNWGKNYYPNSQIKFEYVLFEKHNSYPDFIMKDRNDKIHIFEVKSVDKGYIPGLDEKEYQRKIEELKRMFSSASKITEQNFYIPIRNQGTWVVYRLENGNETVLSETQFREYMKNLV